MIDDNAPDLAEPASLQQLPIQELRRLRTEKIQDETGLSYLRRMVQSPLDIVRSELAHRGAGEGSDLSDLVQDLPHLLADSTRAGDRGRLSQALQPARLDPDLELELNFLLDRAPVESVTHLDQSELGELATQLEQFERKVSERRRDLHHQIDALQAELSRRYRSGEASVETPAD